MSTAETSKRAQVPFPSDFSSLPREVKRAWVKASLELVSPNSDVRLAAAERLRRLAEDAGDA